MGGEYLQASADSIQHICLDLETLVGWESIAATAFTEYLNADPARNDRGFVSIRPERVPYLETRFSEVERDGRLLRMRAVEEVVSFGSKVARYADLIFTWEATEYSPVEAMR